MVNIVWCNEVQSPYNDYLFSELSKSFNLEVFYISKFVKSHPWKFNVVPYRHDYITNNLFKTIHKISNSDIVVISGWSFWQHLAIMLFPFKSVKKIYWTDTLNIDSKKWSGVKGNFRKILSKIAFSFSDEVWSTGKPGCDALISRGCNMNKIKSFPFFTDLSKFTTISKDKYSESEKFKIKFTNTGKEIIFLCVGQLIPRKRYKDVLTALSLINNKNVVIWMVGSGVEAQALKIQAEKFNIQDQVKFMGWLQPTEIELAYLSSDIFIHPAEFDPFPTVVLDAMAWGKPIIGTQEAGSVSDRIINGKNGFIYSAGNVETLKEYMLYFFQFKYQVQIFGSESRKTACDYPIEIAINQLKSLVGN